MPSDLSGASVLIAGAGLAGLVAARELIAMGADVTVVEARERIGGRVWTIRDGFVEGQHAEAGGDFIDEDHREMHDLVRKMGLKVTRILRNGFAYARPDPRGRTRIVFPAANRGWNRLAGSLSDFSRRYKLAERRWDSPIATELARQSVAEWLNAVKADGDLRDTIGGLRGFFVADAEELSLLALVDQFSDDDSPAPWRMYRIDGGADRLLAALANPLGDRIHLNTEVVAVAHRGRNVRVSVKSGRQLSQLQADYLLLTLPASLLRRVPITPTLPTPQHEAIQRIKYGRVTKTVIQFSKRFWRAAGRPRAFGSPLPFGAVWEANEEQQGQAGILALMAGGSSSDATRDIVGREGIEGLVRSLDWLKPGMSGKSDLAPIASRQVVWETEPWSRGGYVFFDPAFDPALRPWLARPSGPLFFAGEHTSLQYQGYMNGAVESGMRAAEEIAAVHRIGVQ
jgi:monoamine oxidase